MSRIVHDGPAVYLNADRSAVVDGGSPDAAFLLVASGGTVNPRFVELYRRLVDEAANEADADDVVFRSATPDPTPEVDEADEPAETPKPRKRTAKRAATSEEV